MTQPTDVVIAGSKSFLAALLAPFTQRVGIRPRVAGDPQQALELCRNPIRLLVFEYQGEQWLPLCRQLAQTAGGAPIIIAAVPPPYAAARPALAEAGVGQFPVWSGDPDHLLGVVEQALREETATPVSPAAAPAPEPITAFEEEIPLDEESIPVDDLEAELFGTDPDVAAAPAPAPAPVVSGGPPALTRPPLDEASAAALSNEAPVEAPPAAPAALVPSEIWPGTVLAAEDAEFLLATAVGGALPRAPALREVTQRVMSALTPLERRALQGGAVPMDGAIVRRASTLRWQVAAALASAPPLGSPIDSEAVAALLAGVDAVLGGLQKAAEERAPAEPVELDQLRNALVKEAIDFTEAVHRLTPDAVHSSDTASLRKTATARVITAYQLSQAPRPSRGHGPWIILAIALVLAGVYHGWYRFARRATGLVGRLGDAPTNTFGMARGSGKALTALPGQSISSAELERFKASEEAKGNTVQEVAPGTWIVVPLTPGGKP